MPSRVAAIHPLWAIEGGRITVAGTDFPIDRPQLLVVVDRNPKVQQMRLILAQPQGEWDDLGGTKVSTGQPCAVNDSR